MDESSRARRGTVCEYSLRRHAATMIVLLVGAFLALQSSATAQIKAVRRVLIFTDLGTLASPGIPLMDQAISAGLQESPYQIELYNETLDTSSDSDQASQGQFRDWLTRKYADRPPNVIIAIGSSSLKFMVESHETSFPNVPLIFCGVTEELLRQLNPDSHFTGIWGAIEPEKTLTAALRLQPNTRRVVVVGGVGAFDRDIERIVRDSFRNYESKFEFTYLTELAMPELLDQLRQLQDNTIVVHTSLTEDVSGGRFVDASQSISLVTGAASAPVFVLDDANIGGGAVGGGLLSWSAEGRAAARMAVR